MDYNIDNILTEWSYRVPTGIIDLKDPYHIVVLGNILKEGKYPPGFASKMLEKVNHYVDNKMNLINGQL